MKDYILYFTKLYSIINPNDANNTPHEAFTAYPTAGDSLKSKSLSGSQLIGGFWQFKTKSVNSFCDNN